eukprot:6486255-Amphidinium_carterae.2
MKHVSSGLFGWTSKSHSIHRTGMLCFTQARCSGPGRGCPRPDWHRSVRRVQLQACLKQEMTTELQIGKICERDIISVLIVDRVGGDWVQRTYGGHTGSCSDGERGRRNDGLIHRTCGGRAGSSSNGDRSHWGRAHRDRQERWRRGTQRWGNSRRIPWYCLNWVLRETSLCLVDAWCAAASFGTTCDRDDPRRGRS